jgi:N-acetylglucosamine-6-phosphate deacetylase
VSAAGAQLVIEGGRAVLPGGAAAEAVSVAVRDGRIAAIAPGATGLPGASRMDARGLWLLPGWIDLQVNDIDWLSRGLQAPAAHARRVREVACHQAARGVTGLVLATLAAPLDEIIAYLEGMREVLERPEDPLDEVFLGALVEGTFMNPRFHGAHNPLWVLPPGRRDALDALIDTRAVRLINVAPETGPEALELVAHATRRGVVVGCGHAQPHAERLREAVGAGLRYIIHLGNGPTGSSWKSFHDGGMLEESLRNDVLAVTIIADNYHVHPQLVRDWIARKEVSRVIGVSDAGFAMGAPAGRFEVFGVRGEAAEGGAYLKVLREDGPPPNPLASEATPLFGSAAGMRDVFENLLNLLAAEMAGVHQRRHPALGLEAALAAASRMCSANPARLLGRLSERGELNLGCRADIVLARLSGAPGSYSVEVVETLVAGSRVRPGHSAVSVSRPRS